MRYPAILASACAGLLIGSAALVLSTQSADAARARSATSIECSKQADGQNLTGKKRKAFRSKCMRQKAS
jgi:psiF repeat-containing protein